MSQGSHAGERPAGLSRTPRNASRCRSLARCGAPLLEFLSGKTAKYEQTEKWEYCEGLLSGTYKRSSAELVILTRLCWDVSPDRISTSRLLTAKNSASNRLSSSFALPFSGIAASFAFSEPSGLMPTTSLFEARGITLTARSTVPSVLSRVVRAPGSNTLVRKDFRLNSRLADH
jgi:hypothetical protein